MAEYVSFLFNKLIRDEVPAIMRGDGMIVTMQSLDDAEYTIALKEKLREEAQEVFVAKSTTELKEELGDVLEVVHALAAQQGLSISDIEAERRRKFNLKGGFQHKSLVLRVSMPADHSHVSYYRARLKDYPEVK